MPGCFWNTKKMCDPGYEEYLKDIATGEYYDNVIPYNGDLLKEAALGERLWQSESDYEPEERLVAAVVSHILKDYIHAILHLNPLQEQRVKNEADRFFRQNGFLESVWEQAQWIINKHRRNGTLTMRDVRLIF